MKIIKGLYGNATDLILKVETNVLLWFNFNLLSLKPFSQKSRYQFGPVNYLNYLMSLQSCASIQVTLFSKEIASNFGCLINQAATPGLAWSMKVNRDLGTE